MALNARYTKGIEIEIGGNATKLKTALDGANRTIKTTQTELDTLRNGLKLEWNPDGFKRAQELAQRALQQTQSKADMLRKALAELDRQGAKKDGEQYQNLQRELSYVQIAAQKARAEIAEIDKLQFSELEANFKRLEANVTLSRASASTAKAELSAVREVLDGEWSLGNFVNAQEAAQKNVEKTGQYVEALRENLAQMDGTDPQAALEIERIKKELVGAETEARKAAKALEEISNIPLERDAEAVRQVQEEAARLAAEAEKARIEAEKLSKVKFDGMVKSLETAAGRLNTTGSILTAGVTVPLVTAGAASVKFASDADESMNKVEVAFGGAAEGVKQWSTTTLNAIGLAQGTALDMAALFGDMGTSMGLPQEAAAEMSRTLVELAADLASFKNISIGEANTALKSIFTGETESLKNLGVVMTEANLKQYALAQGAKTAYEQMSQLEKVQLRYQYVLDMTKNAQGDFARTFDGAANQMRVCRESLKELAATAGGELLPMVTPIIANINGLLQSFGDLDEGTRKLIVQLALAAAALGPLLKLSGGLVSGVGTMLPLLSKLKNALTGVTAAQTALNAAQTATPWGAIATAIGGALAVLGSFALTTALTQERTDSLTESLEESRKAYGKAAEAAREQEADTLAMVSALEELAGAEHKSTAQKAALASLAERLNESVPGLSMAYDAESDSLTDLGTGAAMAAADIRELARAEAERRMQAADTERLTQLYVEETAIANDLAAAQDDLTAAQARTNEMMAEGTYGAMGYEMATADADAAVAAAQKTMQELTAAQADNAAEIAALDGKYREAAGATEEWTASLVHGAAEGARTAEELKELTEDTARHTKTTRTLIDETDALSAAFREQSESGGLSLDTALKLIDAGYAAAVSVDQETGAVRLNAEVYRQLVLEKLNNQQATLEDQRKRVQATLDLRAEAEAAVDAAIAYTTLAGSKEALEGAGDPTISTEELQNQLASLDAQIASLKALKNSLGSGSFGGGGSKRSGGGKANSAYKDALAELAYLRDMDEIDEAEYYERLEALRDKYLKENSEEWRAATVKLHDYRKKAQEDAYTEELADAKYFWDMDLISEADYYQRMAALRDQYLEEDSEAWRRASTELYDYLQKCRDEQLDAAKKGYEAQLDALQAALEREKAAMKEKLEERKAEAKAEYEAKKTAITRELELEKARLNAIIDGIDREIQARRELREDQDQDDVIAKAQKRLEAARAELAYARTDEDREALAKEVRRLEAALAEAIQDKEDTLFYRRKEAEKEAVRDQIADAESNADRALEEAERAYKAEIERLERKYEDAVGRLERKYAAKEAALEAEYRRNLEAIQAQSRSGGSGGSGNSAQSAAAGAGLAASAASLLAGAMGAAAGAVTNSMVQHITRSSSASVTIHEARALTEGEVANTVRKVLDSLDR